MYNTNIQVAPGPQVPTQLVVGEAIGDMHSA